MTHDNPDVWVLAYEQLPPLVRWTLLVLSCGLIGLAGWIVKRYDQRVKALEQSKFLTREEFHRHQETVLDEVRGGFRETHKRIDRLYDK